MKQFFSGERPTCQFIPRRETADHGGGHGEHCVAGMVASREHCTSQPGDRTIPFILLVKGATGRLPGEPSITQVAGTVGALLRLDVPARAGAPVR